MVAGYVSLLYSISDKPLEYWSKQQSQSGRIRKILDSDLLENVIEIQDFEQQGYGTSILCPSDSSQFLNIELPLLVIVVKNLNLQCRIQVQVVDTQNCLHHFQFSCTESEKQTSRGLICRVKIKLETGWNKLELNLSTLTQTVFKTQYAAAQRLQICGNCRLRRVYFIDKHYENQDICPRLYHGFLDSYMLKWGIRTVERSTQTSGKRPKTKAKESCNPKSLSKHVSSENVSSVGINFNCVKNPPPRKTIDESFLNCLQMKTDILIHDFFNRQSAKLPRTLEFKQQSKLKPYAIPSQNTKRRLYGSMTVSEDALQKMDILRTCTDTDICDNNTQKDEATLKGIQENWKHRYFLPQNESPYGNEPSKRGGVLNLKRTMLDSRPKSSLLLSEMKHANAKLKIPVPMQISIESAKPDRSNTAVE